MERIAPKNDRFDPGLHLEDIPGRSCGCRDPELIKPHIDSSIANAEANGYYTTSSSVRGPFTRANSLNVGVAPFGLHVRNFGVNVWLLQVQVEQVPPVA